MKRPTALLMTIWALLVTANWAAGADLAEQRIKTSTISEFEIGIGQSMGGFSYTTRGELLFDGKSFKPALTVRTSEVPKFRISVATAKKIAAVIGLDVDGKSQLYLLDIKKMSSRSITEGTTAHSVYWSPSGRYLVVLCSYEGERFIRVDLTNGAVLDKGFLSPPNSGNMWRIVKMPKWTGNTDLLRTTVNEICNYYDFPECGDKVLAVYTLEIEAATMHVRVISKSAH